LGGALESGTTMGPPISQKQMERVLGYIGAGRDEGAQVVCGGARAGNAGYFVQPTVLPKLPKP
jgi:phenylacetaldehyde dehydrogenase